MTLQGSVKFGIDCEIRRQFLWFQRRKKEINEGKRIREVFQEEAYLGYTESNLLEFLFVTGRLGVNCRLCPCISIPVTQVNTYDVTYTRSSPFAPSNCCPSPFFLPWGNYYQYISTMYSFCLLLNVTYLLALWASYQAMASQLQTHTSNLSLPCSVGRASPNPFLYQLLA